MTSASGQVLTDKHHPKTPPMKESNEDKLAFRAKSAGIKALAAWNLEAENVALISQSENLVYQLDTVAGERFALRVHRPG